MYGGFRHGWIQVSQSLPGICIFSLSFLCVVLALPIWQCDGACSSNLGSNQLGNSSGERSSFIKGPAKVQVLTLYPRLISKLTFEQITQKIKVLLPRKQETYAYQAGIMDTQGRDHLEEDRKGLGFR